MKFALPVLGLMAGFAATTETAAAQDLGFTDPSEIDRAVERFTGRPTGTAGGARRPADSRLKLARCPVELAAEWHGSPGRTVAVRCPTAAGWRIYVSLVAAPQAAAIQEAVKRGETITIAIRGRGFTIQRQGEALEAGAAGSWIAVRISRSVEPVRARIERPGLAVIPLD